MILWQKVWRIFDEWRETWGEGEVESGRKDENNLNPIALKICVQVARNNLLLCAVQI